jgi:MYXO-CTERM domain-containing protein
MPAMVHALTLSLLLAAIPTAGGPTPPAPRPGVLDLALTRLVQSYEGKGKDAFPPAFAGELVPTRQVSCYLRVASPAAVPAMVARVKALGGWAVPLGGRILDAWVPLRRLADLATDPTLVRAEADLGHHRLLDKSVPAIGADRVQAGTGLPRAVRGKGVVLGLVDTGIDYRIKTFAGDDGKTRVQAIWDQIASSGTPPKGYTGGNLCTRADLLDDKCDNVDMVGHGTHVAATAGGRDRVYQGVAPDVDYVVAKSLTFRDLGASVKWVMDTAKGLGEPVVVNLSLGGHYGPHDGTSLESQALDGLSGPGRLLAIAAGNEGWTPIHLGYPLQETPTATEVKPYAGTGSNGCLVDLWLKPGTVGRIDVDLLDATGAVVASTGFIPESGSFTGTFDQAGTPVGQVQIAWSDPDPENEEREANVVILPSSSPDTFAGNSGGYRWVMRLSGHGDFDAWIPASGFLSQPSVFGTDSAAGWAPGDARETVAMPGVAPDAITVAAYATRNSWPDIDGKTVTDASTKVGDIAFFSSIGPTADPALTGLKPEITAPGEWIAAPFGENGLVLDRKELVADGVMVMRGTSMATPHVAGTLALMLSVKPDLTPAEARKILEDTAKHDGFTGTVPSTRWGYGKLDAYDAVKTLLAAEQGPGGGGGAPTGCGCSATSGSPGGAALVALALLGMLAWRRRPRVSRRR